MCKIFAQSIWAKRRWSVAGSGGEWLLSSAGPFSSQIQVSFGRPRFAGDVAQVARGEVQGRLPIRVAPTTRVLISADALERIVNRYEIRVGRIRSQIASAQSECGDMNN